MKFIARYINVSGEETEIEIEAENIYEAYHTLHSKGKVVTSLVESNLES